MNAALARHSADSLYSLILVALVALALALQATFVYGLAGAGAGPDRPALVGKPVPDPCVNG